MGKPVFFLRVSWSWDVKVVLSFFCPFLFIRSWFHSEFCYIPLMSFIWVGAETTRNVVRPFLARLLNWFAEAHVHVLFWGAIFFFPRSRGDVQTCTAWKAPIIWEGMFDPDLYDRTHQKEGTSVALTVFAVGRFVFSPLPETEWESREASGMGQCGFVFLIFHLL